MTPSFPWHDHHFINRNPALDFANMVVWRGQAGEEDRGRSLANLKGWAAHAGLAEPLGDVDHCVTVREAIDRYFRRGEDWPGLVSLYARALADDDDPFLTTILHAAMALAFSPAKARVRICGNCGWLFFDQTRNANKRWCTPTCSSRTKARRHYARKRQGA
ncbi:MAG: CGNR zinc finger domain-containing protein [Parvibaculaceae bacterium]